MWNKANLLCSLLCQGNRCHGDEAEKTQCNLISADQVLLVCKHCARQRTHHAKTSFSLSLSLVVIAMVVCKSPICNFNGFNVNMIRTIKLFPKLDMTQQEESVQKLNITFEGRDKYTELHSVSLSHFKIGLGQARKYLRACSHDPGTTHCPGATH